MNLYGENMEIYRNEGTEFTSINVDFLDDGTLKISGHDMGPFVEEFWGDDDYEYWLFIPEKSVNLFICHLMKLSFNNENTVTFGDCKKILEDNSIEHTFDFWV